MRMRALESQKKTSRRYSGEMKERAVRLVLQLRAETGEAHGSVKRVADQLDIGVESVRGWVKQAEIDSGGRRGTTSVEHARIKELEQRNKELERSNAILRAASVFFAAELDRPRK